MGPISTPYNLGIYSRPPQSGIEGLGSLTVNAGCSINSLGPLPTPYSIKGKVGYEMLTKAGSKQGFLIVSV